MTIRREPTFHGGAYDASVSGDTAAHASYVSPAASPASGFARFVSILQIAGSLLAVPLGLASGYSIYKANFSVETSCQSLRSNIIGMLDKNVDAGTRRMLVRRDIAAFEQNCGSVDPDAHAAFKALLAVPTAAKTKAPVAASSVEPARKPESNGQSRIAAAPEPKATTKGHIGTETRSRPTTDEMEPGLSDARWLAAVRQALVKQDQQRTTTSVATSQPPNTIARPPMLEVSKSPRVVLQPAWNVPATTVAAPAMADVPARTPQTRLNEADHPVPPAPIPLTAPFPVDEQGAGDQQGLSRLRTWIAQVPLLGRVIEPRND